MDRPNILIITTDQQRYDTIHAAGADHMITPNLDRLVEEGCFYSNAYSPNPVCIPARHNILTGLSAKYHGFDDNYFGAQAKSIPHQLTTFPQLLSDHGYDTIGIGKMHFQPCRRHNGFNKLELMEEIPQYREDDEYAMYLKDQGYGDIQSIHGVRQLLYMLPQRSLLPVEHHGSAWVADRSILYLKENGGRRPFLLWSSFIAPHPPFDVPEEWADLYKNKPLPNVTISKTPISELAHENRSIADYPTEMYLQRARELYYAAISFADYHIGRILAQLEEMGELNRTLILFTSDHGEMLGDNDTYQKFLPYDGASRIPFVIRYPKKMKGGTIDSRFVDLNDILPTFLDAAGLHHPCPEILPGESLFAKTKRKDRGIQYLEHSKGGRRWISLRNEAYKYNYYYGGGKEELFDMMDDPGETTNLLYEKEELSAEILCIKENLRNRLLEEEKRQGLEGYVKENQFIEYPDYKRNFYRENNPPAFPKNEKPAGDKNQNMMLKKEIEWAIRKEDVVEIEKLDTAYYSTI